MELPERVAFTPTRKRVIVLFAGCVVFALVGAVALATDADARNDWWPYLCIFGFGVAGSMWLRRLLSREASLVIDTEGISGLDVPKLRWDEIDEMSLRTMTVRDVPLDYLAIVPRSGVDVERRRHPLLALVARMDEPIIGAPITVSLTHLPVSTDEIVELVERYSGRRVSYEDGG